MLLAKALTALVSELEGVGVEYAVVGGLAASARGEVRFTRDVDVAVATRNDADAERLIYQLSQRGYSVAATVEQERTGRLATARLRNADHVVCDLIFATSGIEVEVVSSAEPLELFPGSVVKAAVAEALLAMKVLSATPQRPRDLGDIQAIVNANSNLSEPKIEQLLQLIITRGYSREQDLIEKWRRLKVSLGLRC